MDQHGLQSITERGTSQNTFSQPFYFESFRQSSHVWVIITGCFLTAESQSTPEYLQVSSRPACYAVCHVMPMPCYIPGVISIHACSLCSRLIVAKNWLEIHKWNKPTQSKVGTEFCCSFLKISFIFFPSCALQFLHFVQSGWLENIKQNQSWRLALGRWLPHLPIWPLYGFPGTCCCSL